MDIIILGNGGHSRVIQDMIQSQKNDKIVAILDDKYERMDEKKGILYGPFLYLSKIIATDTKVVVAIGDNRTRKLLTQRLLIRTDQYLSIVHSSAVVSPTARIGYGTVVMPGAYINAGSIIGDHCIINTGSIVEHDSNIGNFTHISPNATLTGNVSVGEGVHVGASATVIPGMHVSDWAVVGAGSTVIEPIPANSTAVGSPTRIVDKRGKENYEDKAVM